MLRRGHLTLASRVGAVLVLLCCFLSLLYVMTCSPPHSDHLSRAGSVHPSLGGTGPGIGGAGVGGMGAGRVAQSGGPPGVHSYQLLLQEREEQHRLHIASLKRQIAQLKEALQERSQQLKGVQESLKGAGLAVGGGGVLAEGPKTGAGSLGGGLGEVHGAKSQQSDLQEFLRSQLSKAEVSAGTRLSSELAVVPFESFTLQRVYQLETGLTRNPEEKPVRKDKRDELAEVLETALHSLNGDGKSGAEKAQAGKVYSPPDFVEGERTSRLQSVRSFQTPGYGRVHLVKNQNIRRQISNGLFKTKVPARMPSSSSLWSVLAYKNLRKVRRCRCACVHVSVCMCVCAAVRRQDILRVSFYSIH